VGLGFFVQGGSNEMDFIADMFELQWLQDDVGVGIYSR
jgi:hypothetical protein